MARTLVVTVVVLTIFGASPLRGQDTSRGFDSLSKVPTKGTPEPKTCNLVFEKDLKTEPWVGEWKNLDADTTDLTRIVIKLDGDKLSVRAFGKCEPTDCDWGATGLRLCSVNGSKSETVAFAKWDHGFEDTNVILRMKSGKISAESFAIYKDKSGRACFVSTETFVRTRPKDRARNKD